MSTPAEQIATGPYWVEKSNSVWVIMGPDGRWPWHFTSEEAALLRAKDLTIAYTRGQQDRWSLEDLERIMVHVGIAVAEYDPFPNQVDERDFLANIRDNLAIEYGLVPKPDPSGLVQFTSPPNPEQR